MKKGRYFHRVLIDDTNKWYKKSAYILGGREIKDSLTQRCEKLNLLDGSSSDIADMPEPVIAFASAQAFNNLFVIGGKGKMEKNSGKIQIYNIKNDKWNIMTQTLPQDSVCLSACFLPEKNQILIFGTQLKCTYALDLVSLEFIQAGEKFISQNILDSNTLPIKIGQQVYAFDSGSSLFIFDINEGRWEQVYSNIIHI